MLTVEDVEEVKRLIALGLSARAVARRTGVSRSSVLDVRNGKRTDKFGRSPVTSDAELGIDPPSYRWLWFEGDGYRVKRCRCCGSRAYIRPQDGGACLACRIRRSVAAA